MSSRFYLLMTIAAFCLISRTNAATAREASTLDLVGENAALCLEIPQLESTWKRVQHSRFADRVKGFSPFQRFLQGAGFQQWSSIENYVANATGKPLSEQLLGLCSESLVIAVYLPEGEKPQGVVIARARNASALQQALESWGKLEPQHTRKSHQHRGQMYVQRRKSATAKESLFYAILDDTLVMSDHESLIHQAIELQLTAEVRSESRATGGLRSLRDAVAYRQSRSRLRDDGAATMFVNARSWDQVLRDGAKHDHGALALLKGWQSVSAICGSIRFDEGTCIDVVAELERESLPKSWSRLVSSSETQIDWSKRIPSEALLAISGRFDTRLLVEWWLSVAPEAQSDDFVSGRRVLRSLSGGRDFFQDLLPELLSDVSIYATARTDKIVERAPFDVFATLSWNSVAEVASDSDVPPLSQSLDNLLQFGMNLLTAHFAHTHSDSRVTIGSESNGTTTTRWLKGLSHWEPGYRVAAQRLLVSSSRDMFERGRPAASIRVANHERRFFPAASQLVWIDVVQLREALKANSEWIAKTLSRNASESNPQISARLTHLNSMLELIDAAFLAGSIHADHVRVIIGSALD